MNLLQRIFNPGKIKKLEKIEKEFDQQVSSLKWEIEERDREIKFQSDKLKSLEIDKDREDWDKEVYNSLQKSYMRLVSEHNELKEHHINLVSSIDTLGLMDKLSKSKA